MRISDYVPLRSLRRIGMPRFFNLRYTMRYLLALPFLGLLWIPFFNRELPALFGFPFFYWYQLAWIPLTALIIWLVYQHEPKQVEE